MSQTNPQRPVIVIVGPTAGGKTHLAVSIARGLGVPGECINADSMQIYRGMDIGTAKPTMEERCGVPHHLLDVADPDTPFTLEDWHRQAEEAIADVRSRGAWPIVVGGSNLYVQALLFGLLQGPPADLGLRAQLDALDDDTLRTRLEAADPQAAQRIHRADRRRTIRALEVAASGTTISSLQTQWNAEPRSDALLVGLEWPTEAINSRINQRVKAMAQAGLAQEVRRLAPRLGPQAREALGYRQLLDNDDLDEALEQVKIRTRRFAKQQRTWLRRFRAIPRSLWLSAADLEPQSLADKAIAWILQESPLGADSRGSA
ncbi:MAG: tRNA (adenosine(37)-N6)-dimethylallyltransferase MiaA [Phycisphaerales bacterium]|nr:tRNA (adenosine(37)-N6)-dimethylallyltransferase MiaA [Phycisphaerales bacterium]